MAGTKILSLTESTTPVGTMAIGIADSPTTNKYITITNLTKIWVGQVDANANNLINFGYIESNATNPATTGVIRLGNSIGEGIYWRDVANTFDDGYIRYTSADILQIGAATNVSLQAGGSTKFQVGTSTLIANVQLSMGSNDVDFSTGGLSWAIGEDIAVQTGVMVFDMNSTDSYSFDIATVPEYVYSATQADFLGNNLVNVGFLAFDDTNTSIQQNADDLQYDVVTLGVHQFRVNNIVEVSFNANTMNLTDGYDLRWNSDNSAIITYDSGAGMLYDTPAGEIHEFDVNTVIEYVFDATQADFKSNNIVNLGLINAGTAYQRLRTNAGATAVENFTETVALEWVIDGGGAVITTGIKGDLEIPFDCEIESATLLADVSGSIVVDVWVDTYANFPPTNADTITSSTPPTITTAVKSQDVTLTTWTKTLTKGSIIRFNVDSVTTIQRVTLSLRVIKRG